ncbi:MAG: hypothetical protein FWE04_03990 [Oscillospiraceae bacterium]|nr:hypothetical protein [Oscillospiraceae bacterium]
MGARKATVIISVVLVLAAIGLMIFAISGNGFGRQRRERAGHRILHCEFYGTEYCSIEQGLPCERVRAECRRLRGQDCPWYEVDDE